MSLRAVGWEWAPWHASPAAVTGRKDPASSTAWPVLAVVLGALIPQTWFSGGKGIASGDIPPFVAVQRPTELVGTWTHLLDGAGSASYQISRAAEAFFWILPGPPELAQRFFYAALCASLVGAAFWALGPLSARRWLRALVALVVLVNPYTMTQVPNALPLAALVGVALGCGSIYRLYRQPASHWWVAVGLASLPFSYVANNPPLLVISILTVLGFVVVCVVGNLTRPFLIGLGKASALALLANAWWITAFLISLSSGDAGGVATTTDVAQWTWTHGRSTIGNVLTLNSTWAWVYPEYFPYASRLSALPWNPLRLGLPLVALLAPVVVAPRRRVLAWISVGVVALLVLIGKGVHEPLGWLNRAGYDILPGAWLFREPGAKVGVPMVLLLAALATATVDELLERARGAGLVSARVGAAVAASVLVASSLAYSHPVWTGEVVARNRPILPSARVKLPEEWKAAARFLNHHDRTGKALLLPLKTYYQARTTWGYYGADFLPSLVERPLVSLNPQSYFGAPPTYEVLVREAADALISRDRSRLGRAEERLGVETLIIRRDIVASSEDAKDFDSAARRLLGPPAFENSLVAVFDGLKGRIVTGYDAPPGTPGDGGFSAGGPLVEPIAFDAPTKVLEPYEPSDVSLKGGVRRFRVSPASDSSTALRVQPLSDVLLDGSPIEPQEERRFAVGTTPAAVSSGPLASVVEGPGTSTDVALKPGEVIQFAPLVASASPVLGEAHSCAGPTTGLVRGFQSERKLELIAGAGQLACVSATQVRPPQSDIVSLAYTAANSEGRPPCVLVQPAARCLDLKLQQAARSDGVHLSWTGSLRSDTTSAEIFLYSEGGAGETRRVFKDVTLRWFQSMGQSFQATEEPPKRRRIAPGRHELTITGPNSAAVGAFGPVGSCGPRRRGPALGDTSSVETVRIVAQASSACVAAPIVNEQIGETYALQLTYRGVGGRTCVWLPESGRCAEGSDMVLPGANDLVARRLTFKLTEPGSALFLYAASATDLFREVEYQVTSLVRQPAAGVFVRAASEAEDPKGSASVEARQLRPGKVRVRMNQPGIKALVLADRYSTRWAVREVSGTATIGEHTMANGYANGWAVSSEPGAVLDIIYTPDRIVRVATVISIMTVLAGLILVGLPVWRQRPVRRFDPSVIQPKTFWPQRRPGDTW